MPYTRDFAWDVFVSYAHDDNASASAEAGWVSRFKADLAVALRRRLPGSGQPAIFFDTSEVAGNDRLSVFTEAASRAAALVPVLSPRFVGRDWTQREVQAFLGGHPNAATRVFAIECEPLDAALEGTGLSLEPPLDQAIRKPFFETIEGKSYRLTPGSEKWNRRIEDVADDLRKVLVPLAGHQNGTVPAAPVTSGVPVLLAQVTDDLEEERDQLRRHLEQFGVPLLPAQGLWPQGGEAFSGAFAEDLAKAGVYVQLLGPLRGRCPPDLPEGYVRHQRDAARAAAASRRLPLMLWRRPGAEAAAPSDVAELLASPEVRAQGFEAFKGEVVEAWRRASAPPPPAPVQGFMVFVNADAEDMALAAAIGEACGRRGIACLLPLPDGTPEERSADLEDNLLSCSAMVLVWGNATAGWLRGHYRQARKLLPKRENPPLFFALCDGPPPGKPPHNLIDPGLTMIDWRGGADHGALAALLDRLRP
jgi:hypothetical protein